MTENNSERATRDIAVRADAKTDSHLADCAAYRLRLADELKTMKRDIGEDTEGIKNDIAGVKADLKEVKLDLKKQTKNLTFIMGGIAALTKVPDFISIITAHLH